MKGEMLDIILYYMYGGQRSQAVIIPTLPEQDRKFLTSSQMTSSQSSSGSRTINMTNNNQDANSGGIAAHTHNVTNSASNGSAVPPGGI